jgi:hypothetical protein
MSDRSNFTRDDTDSYGEPELVIEYEKDAAPWTDVQYEPEESHPIVTISGGRDPLAVWASKFEGIPITFWESLGVRSEGKVDHRLISFNWPEGWKKVRDVTLRVDSKTINDKKRPRFWWVSPPANGVHPIWPKPPEEKDEHGKIKPHEEIWIAEGESDCAVLRFLGFDAYTFGSSTQFPDDIELRFLNYMGVKRAILVFDADKPGRTATKIMADILSERNAIDVLSLDLGQILFQWPYLKDVRDLFNKLPDHDVKGLLLAARENILKDREEDISAKVIAETAMMPEWAWDGLIGRDALNMVYAEAKTGKTTLTYHIIKAALEGEELLGRMVEQFRVLYYSEMPPSFDKQAMYAICDGPPSNLFIRNSQDHIFEGMTWPGIVMQIERDCKKYRINYVVVDTVIEWFKFSSEEMYDAAVVGEKLRLLRRLTAKGITVQINHHPPKSGGSPFGSMAFQGYVDCLVEMERDDAGTTLSAKGRLRTDFTSLKYAYADPDGRQLSVIQIDDKGDRSGAAGATTGIKARILDVLPYDPGSMSFDEMREKDTILRDCGKQLPNRMRELTKSGVVKECEDAHGRFYRTIGFEVQMVEEEDGES